LFLFFIYRSVAASGRLPVQLIVVFGSFKIVQIPPFFVILSRSLSVLFFFHFLFANSIVFNKRIFVLTDFESFFICLPDWLGAEAITSLLVPLGKVNDERISGRDFPSRSHLTQFRLVRSLSLSRCLFLSHSLFRWFGSTCNCVTDGRCSLTRLLFLPSFLPSLLSFLSSFAFCLTFLLHFVCLLLPSPTSSSLASTQSLPLLFLRVAFVVFRSLGHICRAFQVQTRTKSDQKPNNRIFATLIARFAVFCSLSLSLLEKKLGVFGSKAGTGSGPFSDIRRS
jgi:hypothetical protein